MPSLSPFGVFECADGYVALVAVHEKLARGLFRPMGRPEIGDDPHGEQPGARLTDGRHAVAAQALEERARGLETAGACGVQRGGVGKDSLALDHRG